MPCEAFEDQLDYMDDKEDELIMQWDYLLADQSFISQNAIDIGLWIYLGLASAEVTAKLAVLEARYGAPDSDESVSEVVELVKDNLNLVEDALVAIKDERNFWVDALCACLRGLSQNDQDRSDEAGDAIALGDDAIAAADDALSQIEDITSDLEDEFDTLVSIDDLAADEDTSDLLLLV